MKNFKTLITTLIILVILLLGCTMPGNDNLPGSNNEEANVPETTKVLDESDLSQISSINNDSITFLQPTNFEVGDIIISGISTNTPNGLLRKINSISNQKILTSQATLENAIQDCNVQFSNKLTSSSVRNSTSIQGVSRAVTSNGFDFGININNVVLYDHDGDLITTNDQMRANGFLQFDLTFGFALKIENFKIENLSFQGEIEEELELEINGQIKTANTKRIILTEYLFSPFIAATIPSIPPIPIVVIPKITIYLNLNGSISAELSTDIGQGASLTSGLKYNGYSWSPIMEFEKYFEYSPPTFSAAASTKVSAGSMLTLALYGVAGPYLDTSAYLQASASTDLSALYWQISSGIDVGCGISVAVLGKSLVDYNTTLLNYNRVLASGEQDLISNPPTDKRFTDMNNGTIKDNETSLIWTKNANLYGQLNWNSANIAAALVQNNRHGIDDGSSPGDWRLPTIQELESLTSNDIESPAVPNTIGNGQWSNNDPFVNLLWATEPDALNYSYWSSTDPADLEGNRYDAYIIEFNSGWSGWMSPKTSERYTWFVRDARPDEL